jgi:predicted metalloendopeptidase
MNGVTTQGENVADNGGIEQALQAYHQFVNEHGPEKKLPGLHYTPEQLFFLGFASVTFSLNQKTFSDNTYYHDFYEL